MVGQPNLDKATHCNCAILAVQVRLLPPFYISQQLSGIEHAVSTRSVRGSNPLWDAIYPFSSVGLEYLVTTQKAGSSSLSTDAICSINSIGRVSPLQGEGWRFESVIEHQYARLTEAAFGRVLKTLGTVMSRMGIDTSVWRHLQGCAELLQNISR